MKVIELRDVDKRPQSSKRSIRATSVRGGSDDGVKPKSRSSSSRPGGLPKDSNLYTNDSLDSSFLNKLVYDYKSNLDTIANSKSPHPIEESGRASRKSNKSFRIEETDRQTEDENQKQRKTLMNVLTMSKSSSMTSLKERASFLESSNPTPQNENQLKKDEDKSGHQSAQFDKAQSYATSIRLKSSENLSYIDSDETDDDQPKKKSQFRNYQLRKRPEVKYKQFKPTIKIRDKNNNVSEKTPLRKAIANEDYYRSIARLNQSAKKTQEKSPTRFTTVHDNLKFDSEQIFELTKRLSKSNLLIL